MPIRALIADDEALARRRIRTLLEREPDVTVVGECRDGASTVQAIRVRRPDLVFLDIQMPALDGFQVIEATGAERMPAVIFVTAYDEYTVRAFEKHALDYLVKPFDDERLAAALQHARSRLASPPGRRAGPPGSPAPAPPASPASPPPCPRWRFSRACWRCWSCGSRASGPSPWWCLP